MRIPQDLPRRPPAAGSGRRRRTALVILAVVVVVLLLSLGAMANVFTDYLWFGSMHLASVWRRMMEVKVGLFVAFGLIFFVLLWVNLAIAQRLGPSELELGPEEELVSRYRQASLSHGTGVRTALVLVLAVVAAAGTVGEWQNYLLFSDGGNFPKQTDPIFHMNVGFYVFKLPFLTFVVSWLFVSMVVVTILTLVAHYLNGGIRLHRGPRVAPAVKAHLSAMLGVLALLKAAGYWLARYELELSQNGYVQGLGATDEHARRPALQLLTFLSLGAAAVLFYNVRRRRWDLPAIAVGLWAGVALVLGIIYPWLYQTFKVTPAQSAMERRYIQYNIDATRQAMGLDAIGQPQPFAAGQPPPVAPSEADSESLSDVRIWDPALSNVLSATYNNVQAIKNYYAFNELAIDRYLVNGQETPMIVAVRQIDDSQIPGGQTWVNTHLVYTHGYGMIISPANQSTVVPPSVSNQTPGQLPGEVSGQQAQISLPAFGPSVASISNLPPQSSQDMPIMTQPSIYYGLPSSDGSEADYVVVDSRQSEVDYPEENGQNHTSRYTGPGGVRMANTLDRLAFALRFHDFNLLFSNQIDNQSRIMFLRDIDQEISQAAPFLVLASDPYPALVDGRVDWIQDAYTTTDSYPYAQNVDTSQLPSNSGLAAQNFNYARNSVKVVIDAYTGQMQFYVTAPDDPIIQAWEKAFPGLPWRTTAQMSPSLAQHIRYPEDLFMAQAEMYGRYHIQDAAAFYTASDAWILAPDPGSGPPGSSPALDYRTNAQGQRVPAGTKRMSPIYQELVLPGQTSPSFTLMEAFAPAGGNSVPTLAGFIVAGSDPGQYGQLKVYTTPPGQAVSGPIQVENQILGNRNVSDANTLLDQHGSAVELGNLAMVPIGQSVIYFQPLYVESTGSNPVPALAAVITAFPGTTGTNYEVVMDSTLSAVIQDAYPGALVNPPGGTSQTGQAPVNPAIQALINQETALSQAIQSDLSKQDLGQYQADVQQLQNVIAELHNLASSSTAASNSSQSASPTGGATGSQNGSTSSSSLPSPSSASSGMAGTGSASPANTPLRTGRSRGIA